ncbi:hypothetical protein Peur_063806 [Populus x canadensis]
MLLSLHLSYCLCFEMEEYEHGLLRGVNIGGMVCLIAESSFSIVIGDFYLLVYSSLIKSLTKFFNNHYFLVS